MFANIFILSANGSLVNDFGSLCLSLFLLILQTRKQCLRATSQTKGLLGHIPNPLKEQHLTVLAALSCGMLMENTEQDFSFPVGDIVDPFSSNSYSMIGHIPRLIRKDIHDFVTPLAAAAGCRFLQLNPRTRHCSFMILKGDYDGQGFYVRLL